ncbi:MAG TPA: caspase family protein, partial [Fredinandcohnia sp.]|nr:caspase family protein [Fredinandcohnia sp.]
MRALVGALALMLLAAPAEAARRHAVVIGANVGGPHHEPLRYAETDAARMAAVLRDVGGFAPGDVVLLTRTDASSVRQALIELNARIREEPGPSLIFVYYSGHGDARAIHLYGTQLDLTELKNLVAGSPARSRVLVVDACQSGAITRVKGGTPVPEFDIAFERGTAEGLAILTSSSASEDAQESDELGASIFTHHLVSALLGAADRDGNGLITLGEAFAYSSERTLAVSSSTRVGPQHPTYRFDLGGRDDIVLSRPISARNMGLLVLPDDGVWVVRDALPRGGVVAEVVADAPGARLALRPGRYAILRRGKDHLLEGEVEVEN